MDTYDFVHLALLAVGGEIKGKTKLQKTMYFLGLLTGHLGDLGYRPHFYGPYSEDVAHALGRLRSVGFIDQNVSGGGAWDQKGFEVYRYDYRLNEDGCKVAEAKKRKYRELWAKLTKAAALLKGAGETDYMKLSVAAKTYFLLGEKHGPATNEELARLAPRFGWLVNPDEINDAARFLKKLGLVELAGN